MASLTIDRTVGVLNEWKGGEEEAMKRLKTFCDQRLKIYSDSRNDPTSKSLSDLSPYLHFGQIASQRAILEAQKLKKISASSVESFVEEIMVRKELADNFCFYNPNYDNLNGANDWAKKTLDDHRKDKREFVYTLKQFELGVTHDDLWNACQLQMVREGKMFGFLRMYWAKKILEWTPDPETALKVAIYLNDKYELDGRDPNGYVGCAWAIMGTHDQGWAERSVFGKIRYMNYQGCKRKFDVEKYVSRYPGAKPNSTVFKQNLQEALKNKE
eukprot:TRINITY_DN1546_c0_g1_i4.p1 TRINITY_DN1546_c0_g1~~TRINITY_DN1546_c0_g1_i4.p1  ORF type:complete len:271 (-),score=59.93 TRINITY_DN1546_c0_g1_i4:6-818(-)